MLICVRLTCKLGGQWSSNSSMCLIFWASWMTKFSSISNSPPTNYKERKIQEILISIPIRRTGHKDISRNSNEDKL